ncbi:MAG: hypothetical protein ACTSVB_04415 [Candidatus Heimdallarchaeaceae archaeon]
MKNILLASLLILVLTSPIVFATGQQGNTGQQGDNGNGTGSNNSDINQTDQGNGQGGQTQIEEQTENQGEEGNITIQQQTKAKNKDELKQMIQEKKDELKEELKQFKAQQKEIHQNQNQVRVAVHALLAMENLTGGIGQNVSAIAKEFNNSIQATLRAEEKIQKRNALVKIFIGGDEDAANEIEQEVTQNQERIQKLTQLMEQCECDEEVKAILQEQIQNMEQEQTRLQQLAQNEKQNKGIFGWLWKK